MPALLSLFIWWTNTVNLSSFVYTAGGRSAASNVAKLVDKSLTFIRQGPKAATNWCGDFFRNPTPFFMVGILGRSFLFCFVGLGQKDMYFFLDVKHDQKITGMAVKLFNFWLRGFMCFLFHSIYLVKWSNLTFLYIFWNWLKPPTSWSLGRSQYRLWWFSPLPRSDQPEASHFPLEKASFTLN